MDTKVLLRLIQDDIKILEGINESFINQENPAPEEIEVALVRSRALVMEFEMLAKNLSREVNETGSGTKLPNEIRSASEDKNGKSEKKISSLRNFLPFIKVNEEISKELSAESISIDTPAEIKESVSESLITVNKVIQETLVTPLEEPLSAEVLFQEETVSVLSESPPPNEISTETEINTSEFETSDQLKISVETRSDSEFLADEPVQEKKALGEILGEKQQLVNDMLSPEKTEARYDGGPLKNIRDGIGINDRFLFIMELFNNSPERYNYAVSTLDSLNNIEDAVRFLKQNYKWNKSEAAKKFLLLVKRRFMKSHG